MNRWWWHLLITAMTGIGMLVASAGFLPPLRAVVVLLLVLGANLSGYVEGKTS